MVFVLITICIENRLHHTVVESNKTQLNKYLASRVVLILYRIITIKYIEEKTVAMNKICY